MPLRSWQRGKQGLYLIRECRGRDGLGKYPQSAFRRLLRGNSALSVHGGTNSSKKRRPGHDLPEIRECLRTVGIIKSEHRSLREDIGRAEACGMVLVAFDLGRPALVTFDNQSRSEPVQRHRSSKKHRLARHEFFRLARVGRDVLGWLSRACGESREGERGAHQFEELAAANRIAPLSRSVRKLSMKQFLKLVCLGQLFKAPPVLLT